MITNTCPACGNKVNEKDKYCTQCGCKINKNKHIITVCLIPIIIFAIYIVYLIIGNLILFISNNFKENQTSDTMYSYKVTNSLRNNYTKSFKYCSKQNFRSRGEWTACIEESIINFNKDDYNEYIKVYEYCQDNTTCASDQQECLELLLIE